MVKNQGEKKHYEMGSFIYFSKRKLSNYTPLLKYRLRKTYRLFIDEGIKSIAVQNNVVFFSNSTRCYFRYIGFEKNPSNLTTSQPHVSKKNRTWFQKKRTPFFYENISNPYKLYFYTEGKKIYKTPIVRNFQHVEA